MRNDRWSNSSEIKRVLQADTEKSQGGAVLYCKNGRHWKYTSEGHLIFLGVSGSGKSRRGTIPMTRSFIEAEETFVVVDPKGEIYAETAPFLSDRYQLRVIDFRNIFESACVNLLAAPAELFRSGEPAKKQVAMEMIDNLAHTLYPVSEKADPFWPQSAQSVFIGAVYGLMEHAEENEINMASVYQFIARGEESFGMGGSFLKSFVNELPENCIARMLLQSYISTASDTRAGVRSTLLEGISIFAKSEGLVSMMSSDDLQINRLDGETPTAIYIILPDESPIYDKVATNLLSQLMGHYVRLAQDKYHGRLPRRVNFLVEEAGNVGRIGSLGHLLSAGRSRNIRCQLVLQNYSQLDMIYGAAEATTIRSNADVLVAFRTNHWETLTELSHKCGELMVEGNGHTSNEPLITPSQLASMQTGQALVMISGATKFISWIPDYTEIFDCKSMKAPRHTHTTIRKEPALFDIREYVKRERQRKMTGSASSNSLLSENKPLFPPKEESKIVSEGLSGFSIDRMVAEIDAKIAALEEEEKRKSEADRKFSFSLVDKSGSKMKLIKAIRDNTYIPSLEKAREVVEHLPYTFRFDSKKTADRARAAILEAGGILADAETSGDEYRLIILDEGENIVSATKALRDATGITLTEAIRCMKELPFPMEFASLDEAKRVADSLKKAGAKIITFGF